MVKIISDSSTLYSVTDGLKEGIKILPLNVSVNGKSYREFEDISSTEFIKLVRDGGIPTSSQPSIGEKVEAYQACGDDEVLDLTMADGLSGTYNSSLTAKDMASNKDNIHVVNTKTLCGPHRYIVNEAIKLAKEGKTAQEIIDILRPTMDNGGSFLIPADFGFLKRGGRLTPLAATIGGLIKIIPVMLLEKDGKKINKYSIKKTIRKVVDDVVDYIVNDGADANYDISVSHADNLERALLFKAKLEERIGAVVHIYDLSPAFITQGGPDCVAIQWCKKVQ